LPPNHIANIAKIANMPTLFRDPGEIRAAWAVRYGQGMAEVPDETQLAAALKKRSKRFAIDVIWLCRQFPHSVDAMVVAKQLIKAPRPLRPTIERRAERALRLISYPELVWSPRKPTNPSSGSN
jgi:hypothetical protein